MGLRGPKTGHIGTPSVRLRASLSVGGLDSCWEWQGAQANGYGVLWVDGRPQYVHRLVWTHLRDPIPDGLTLDHLCRNSACANPRHLEVVTHRENILRGTGVSAQHARKTHCKRGHEFTSENTRIETNGARRCLTCERARRRSASASGDSPRISPESA
jgi:hypothetical protein